MLVVLNINEAICPVCRGTGYSPWPYAATTTAPSDRPICDYCKGAGKVRCQPN